MRDRCAVDLDEGPFAAGRGGVDGAGDEILADAALTPDEHRRVGISDALDDRPDFPHAGVAIKQREMIDKVFHIVPRVRTLR